MKRALLLSLCLILCLSLSAQTEKEAITSTVESYFGLLQEEKISEALDMVHPDLINMIGKEMFEQQYNQLLNDADMDVSFGELKIKQISETKTHEKGVFALLGYSFEMDYVLNHNSDDVKNIVANTLKAQFGEEGFSRDGDNVTVTSNREMFVISREDWEGWRILDYEKGMRMILVSIMPEEILEHFGK